MNLMKYVFIYIRVIYIYIYHKLHDMHSKKIKQPIDVEHHV
jgi:hypothetical protein